MKKSDRKPLNFLKLPPKSKVVIAKRTIAAKNIAIALQMDLLVLKIASVLKWSARTSANENYFSCPLHN